MHPSARTGRLHARRAARRLRDLARRLRRHAHRVGQRLALEPRARGPAGQRRGGARLARSGRAPAAQPREPDGQRDHDDRPRDGLRLHLPDLGPERRPGSATACRRSAAAPRPRPGRCGRTRAPAAITTAMRGSCPGTGWTRSQRVVQHVTNWPAASTATSSRYECSSNAAADVPVVDGRLPEDHQRRHESLGRRRHDGPGHRAQRHHERLPAQPERGADGPRERADDAQRVGSPLPAQRLRLDRSRGPHARVLLVRGHPPSATDHRRDVVHGGVRRQRVAGRHVHARRSTRRHRRARRRRSTCSSATRAASRPCPRRSPSRAHHEPERQLSSPTSPTSSGWVLVSAIVLTLIMLVDRASSPRAWSTRARTARASSASASRRSTSTRACSTRRAS